MKFFKKIQRMTAFSLTLLILVQPCLASDALPGRTAQEHCQAGRQKYLAGDNQGSLESAKAAIALEPGQWEAFQIAGYASFKLGDKSAALDYCRKSLDLHPENPALQGFLDKISPAPSGLLTQSDQRLQLPSGFVTPADTSLVLNKEKDREEAYRQVALDLKDVDTGIEFGGGFAAGFLIAPALGLAGAIAGIDLAPQKNGEDYTGAIGNLMARITMGCLGGAGGYLLGLQAPNAFLKATAGEPNPGPARLQGRSENFQTLYTSEFKKRGRNKKREQVGEGESLGILLSLPVIAAFFIVAESDGRSL